MSKFSFNLLPKKSKDLIAKEQKRDSYSIYYSFLILIGVVLWLGLLLVNNFVVDRTIKEWEDSNRSLENKIEKDYADVRTLHGELVAKTRSIYPLLKRDIDPEAVFLVADEAFSTGEGGATIVGYGRNDDGSFSISIAAANEQIISSKARQLKNLRMVENLEVDSVSFDPERNAEIGIINFEVIRELL